MTGGKRLEDLVEIPEFEIMAELFMTELSLISIPHIVEIRTEQILDIICNDLQKIFLNEDTPSFMKVFLSKLADEIEHLSTCMFIVEVAISGCNRVLLLDSVELVTETAMQNGGSVYSGENLIINQFIPPSENPTIDNKNGQYIAHINYIFSDYSEKVLA